MKWLDGWYEYRVLKKLEPEIMRDEIAEMKMELLEALLEPVELRRQR